MEWNVQGIPWYPRIPLRFPLFPCILIQAKQNHQPSQPITEEVDAALLKRQHFQFCDIMLLCDNGDIW